jgi:hypothetical protein
LMSINRTPVYVFILISITVLIIRTIKHSTRWLEEADRS